MSMKTLKEALAEVKRDTFEDGTVIRWLASGRYTYAALKTPVGWYTTAKAMPDYAQRVPQVVNFEQLLNVLGKSEVSKIEVASTWVGIDD